MGLKRNLILHFLFCGLIAQVLGVDTTPNSYDPEYGVFVGSLSNLADGDVEGKVYVINETALQIVNFTYNGKAPDLYFWLDKSETPTKEGLKIPTFESGITPLPKYENVERVVLLLPGLHKVYSYKSLSLFCYTYDHNFGSVLFPEGLIVPKPQILGSELRGNRYSVGSGPIMIHDRRTIKVYAFTFDGDKAPDGYFFVGRGPNVAHDAGVKVPIRGRDTTELITAMNERYKGGQDLYIDLPEDYDTNHIDWLSIYCYKFRVDFGHVPITNVSQKIPPYVPPQKKFEDMELQVEGWPVRSLLGTANRTNFTMQLGPPGGKRGYQAMARARPNKNVWYVNGYLAEVYLKRGVTYNFIVEGGNDPSTNAFYNPLYISSDPFGGYSMLSNDEQQQVTIYASSDPSKSAGRKCLWSQKDENEDADKYNSFEEFKQSLTLKCVGSEEAAGKITFTPNDDTPDTVYYQ
uniref:Protein Skeletor n=1 Tax=Steinernema glaseri TaxID=37863 RepID=A0A1I7Y720_9BILA